VDQNIYLLDYISSVELAFLIYMKSLLEDDHPDAHAKVKKWIFDVQFPGNWFEFDIIGNDFLILTT